MTDALEPHPIHPHYGPCDSLGPAESCAECIKTLDAAKQRIADLERMDREAAEHVESLICVRTHFTGEPPYVGWEGLGLALREHLDRQEQRIAELERLLKGAEWSSKHNYDGWMQEVERAKEAHRTGFLACQRQAVDTARVHPWPGAAYGNDEKEETYVLACRTIAQAISQLKPSEGDNA